MLLSLDVGFASMGWAVFDRGEVISCGTIVTKKDGKKTTRSSSDTFTRCVQIATQLKDIIHDHSIEGVIGELPSGGAQSANAMKQMGMATSIVASVCGILGLPFEEVTPNEVKIAVCGSRSATKEEIMSSIRRKFRSKGAHLFPEAKCHFEHIADACGAYLHAQMSGYLLVKMFG